MVIGLSYSRHDYLSQNQSKHRKLHSYQQFIISFDNPACSCNLFGHTALNSFNILVIFHTNEVNSTEIIEGGGEIDTENMKP